MHAGKRDEATERCSAKTPPWLNEHDGMGSPARCESALPKPDTPAQQAQRKRAEHPLPVTAVNISIRLTVDTPGPFWISTLTDRHLAASAVLYYEFRHSICCGPSLFR